MLSIKVGRGWPLNETFHLTIPIPALPNAIIKQMGKLLKLVPAAGMMSRDIKGWDSLLSFLKQSAELPEKGMCEKINKQLVMEAGRSMWDLLAWQSRPSDYGDMVGCDGWGSMGGTLQELYGQS